MSYCSENQLPLATSINRLIEVIELLGYVKCRSEYKIAGELGSYYWESSDDGISFVGVTLEIYKEENYISVQTRTRVGRSYWDLKWQNKTISLLKALFGGKFITDEGTNRYLKIDESEPSKISCALYENRWVFHNALLTPQIYLDSIRNINEMKLTGLQWIDHENPKVLSSNMIIPYLIGSWEAYFRGSFISILRYADDVPDRAVKNCRLTNLDMMNVIRNGIPLEDVAADRLSFQRPSVIAENFKQLNSNIDIAGWFRKPFHGRKTTLFDSITYIIDIRDSFVHMGGLDLSITEEKINHVIEDMTEAANRAYNGFGDVFDFDPSYNF